MNRMATSLTILLALGWLVGAPRPVVVAAQDGPLASRIPPQDVGSIRQQAAQQATRLARLPLETRRQILLDFVLNAFAQSARLPGFDTQLLNPAERDQAQRIVDQILTPTPNPAPMPSPRPTPPPPRPNPGPSPAPAPAPDPPGEWIITVTIIPDTPAHSHGDAPVPSPTPVYVPAHPWGGAPYVVTYPQWVPVQVPVSTTTRVRLGHPWHR